MTKMVVLLCRKMASLLLVAISMFSAFNHPTFLFAATAATQATEEQRERQLIEGAKKEGKLVIWESASAKEWQVVFEKFRQKYPFVVIEYWRGNDVDTLQKITAEARAGIYNVDVAGSEIAYLSELKKAGLMKKYSWPNTKGWPPSTKDPEGYWAARSMTPVVVTYNTDMVSGNEAPKSWEDLLNPKWANSISMDRDGGEWVLMMWAAWGKEKTVNYLKNLSKNNVILAGGGSTARMEMLAAGANKIDLRLNLHRILPFQKKGAPLEWMRTDPILSKADPFFIAQYAPHPNAAMLFVDWLTSSEGQQLYSNIVPFMLPDPTIKNFVAEALKGMRVVNTPPELAVNGNEAEKVFRDLFMK